MIETWDRRRWLFVAGVLAVCSLLPIVLARAASADTFTYRGPSFTQFFNGDVCPPQCNISGSFTLNGPLSSIPNITTGITEITSLVTSFSFTDGNATITNLSPFLFPRPSTDFGVQAGANGLPLKWGISVQAGFIPAISSPAGPINNVTLFTETIPGGIGVCDSTTELLVAGGNIPQAFTPCPTAGTFWSTPPPVPEPSSLMLLSTGLLAAVVRMVSRRHPADNLLAARHVTSTFKRGQRVF